MFFKMAQQTWCNRRVRDAQQIAVDVRKRKLMLARRYRSAKTFFVAFCFYTACLSSLPMMRTVAPKVFRSSPLLQLWFRLVVPLAFLSIPVSTIQPHTELDSNIDLQGVQAKLTWLAETSFKISKTVFQYLVLICSGSPLNLLLENHFCISQKASEKVPFFFGLKRSRTPTSSERF